MFLFLFVGLMLSFMRPELQEAQSKQADKKRMKVPQIDWGSFIGVAVIRVTALPPKNHNFC